MISAYDDFSKKKYHQIKTSINFLCRQRLNHKSFIQPLETLKETFCYYLNNI